MLSSAWRMYSSTPPPLLPSRRQAARSHAACEASAPQKTAHASGRWRADGSQRLSGHSSGAETWNTCRNPRAATIASRWNPIEAKQIPRPRTSEAAEKSCPLARTRRLPATAYLVCF
uniref:Uncharacterized protein n=1 Tax=Arundo donax TaxID=35708 RepID=A0A0A9DA67_ARUDO